MCWEWVDLALMHVELPNAMLIASCWLAQRTYLAHKRVEVSVKYEITKLIFQPHGAWSLLLIPNSVCVMWEQTQQQTQQHSNQGSGTRLVAQM